ncbi:hypothetical protein ACFVRB_41930 [Streptomyces nojiriensis]|uniref:hypothetical protein n=1 Tax=Streptomyces nojiriensis TaxID=66374 RepID=UPI0036DAC41B
MRKLSRDQHVVIGEPARAARALAAEAGQAVSESVLHEVEQILHAVLADPGVAEQWAEGRLTKAPDTVLGFTGLEPLPGAARPRRAQDTAPTGSAADHVPVPEPDTGKRAVRARHERVEAARTALVEAQGEAERSEDEHAAAQELVDRAEEDVRAAGEQLETARAASADAVTALRDAGRAAAKVRRQAEAAAREVERLTGSSPGRHERDRKRQG